MKFTVKRSEWYRGKGNTDSRLLHGNGEKCCVGFQALAHGLTEDEIRYCPDLAHLNGTPKMKLSGPLAVMVRLNTWNENYNSCLAGEIYEVNDDQRITDELREQKLKVLFAKVGDEVEFMD